VRTFRQQITTTASRTSPHHITAEGADRRMADKHLSAPRPRMMNGTRPAVQQRPSCRSLRPAKKHVLIPSGSKKISAVIRSQDKRYDGEKLAAPHHHSGCLIPRMYVKPSGLSDRPTGNPFRSSGPHGQGSNSVRPVPASQPIAIFPRESECGGVQNTRPPGSNVH